MTIAPINRASMAEQTLSDMQKLMPMHPRTIDVVLLRAIFSSTADNPDDSGIGNLDFNEKTIDHEAAVTIKMLEIVQEQKAKLKLVTGIGISGELEEPILVLLSEKVAEQSIIIVYELDGENTIDSEYIVLESQAIGRDGKAGSIYQLIPYRDANEEVEEMIEQEIEKITGDPPQVEVEPVTDNGFTWGEQE